MSIGFYYRDGTPIEGDMLTISLTWGRLNEDDEYRVVALTELEKVSVSTVWLGFDHGYGHTEQPVIFETMVFGAGASESGVLRWTSEEQAKEGHEAVVKTLMEKA